MIDLGFDLCRYYLVVFVTAVFHFHKYFLVRSTKFVTSVSKGVGFSFSLWVELPHSSLLNNT